MIEEFHREGDRLKALQALIGSEIKAFNETFGTGKELSDFGRRCLYRTIFSSIEAYISHLKSSALLFTIDRPDVFSEAERFALRDLEHFVDNKGMVGTRSARIRLKDNLRLAFRLFGRAMEKDYQVGFDSPGGISFTSAIKVRDRLTHPKDPRDWQIGEAEAKMVIDAWKWFGEHLVEVSRSRKQGTSGGDASPIP